MQETFDLRGIQNEITSFVSSDVVTSHIRLGYDFRTLNGPDAIENLIKHRTCNKFVPTVEQDSERRRKSVAATIEFDEGRNWNKLEGYDRYVAYNVKNTLHAALRGFKLDLQDFDFPSGGTFTPSGGDVSLVKKLREKKFWTVTPDCFELFASIVYANMSLKRVANAHFEIEDVSYERFKTEFKGRGFNVFKYKLKKICTFVFGSRIETVPKNKDMDRTINIEPFGNMIVQRCIAKALLKCFKKNFGYDLHDGQSLHNILISDCSNATIDLSNASNSHLLEAFKFYFPKRVVDLCLRSRSAVSHFKDSDTWVHWNMLSPMGNGFTFEVMTFFLMVASRYFDSCAHVFGDDIIIHNDCSYDLINFLTANSWVVNDTKTFINSPFRESCGAFYHDDVGYITSFDIHYPVNEADCVVLINKLAILGRSIPEYKDVWSRMLSFVPAFALRVLRDDDMIKRDHLSQGVFCSKSYHYRRTRKSTTCKSLYERNKQFIKTFETDNHYKGSYIIKIPIVKAVPYRSCPKDEVRDPWWIAHYYRNGMTLPVKRETTIRYVNHIVFDDSSHLLRLSSLPT